MTGLRARRDANVYGGRAFGLAALAVIAVAFVALELTAKPTASAGDHVVEYWIAAVPVNWHVVPNERDGIMGTTFDPAKTTFQTVVYRQYTPNWARQLPNEPGDEGIQGPRDPCAGRRHDPRPLREPRHGLQPAALDALPRRRTTARAPTAPTSRASRGRARTSSPGKSFTYRLIAGPDSVGVWPYHDHSPSMDDSLAGGMYGALSILAPGERPPDHEFVVFLEQTLDFMTIDGRAFVGNTPVFHAKVGDLVQWDVLALGDDFHTFHVHGHRWKAPDGDRHRHADGRAGGELQDPVARGCARARGSTTATSRRT